MANGAIFREIKRVLETHPESITPDVRDRLMLEGMCELHERIDSLPKLQTGDLRKVARHEVTLYGDGTENNVGLVKDVQDIKKFVEDLKKDIKKFMWSILAPILAILGVGIVVLIVLGATLGK
jgi:hypothetical protein